MADTITVLKSKGPVLAKRWTVEGIQAYDKAKHFAVSEVTVASIEDLSRLLLNLEAEPKSCVVRGRFNGEDRDSTTRTLKNFAEAPHHWVCLDVDNHDAGAGWLVDPVSAINSFIASELPPDFSEVSYHWQLSNSAGSATKETLLKAHLWFWLEKARTGAELEAWARSTGAPVDITVFRTVQVHYTAGPVIDPGVVCPVETRSGFVRGLLGDDVLLTVVEASQAASVPAQPRLGRAAMTDPRQKKGMIGAFCRAYPPDRAVSELLTAQFEFEGDDDRRLTWLGGGGAPGGAVITDDGQHVYNGHNTDPCRGRAVNSWDLCRVHLFGEMDADMDEEAIDFFGPAGTPSHAEMVRFAEGLDEVAEDLAEQEQEQQAAQEKQSAEERLERLAHIETLKQGVLQCSDVEALKTYIRDTIVPDKVIDDADRNGALTIAAQSRFRDLGSPQPRDDVRKMLRPAVTVASGVSNAPPWLNRWVYVTKEDKYFDLDRKKSVTSRAFDALQTEQMPLRMGSVNVRQSASDWAINVWGIRTVDYNLYAPGEDEVFRINKMVIANEFDPDTVPEPMKGGEGAIRVVNKHLERLFPDERERALLLSWMAHLVRHPGKKIRWAPYISGAEGVGKSFIGDLMEAVLGTPQVKRVSGKTLAGQFTGWAAGKQLTVIEEAYQVGHRYDVPEVLKAPITNDKINIHKKGIDDFEAPNYTSYLIMSNHADGIPITEGDRRYFFLESVLRRDEAAELTRAGYFDRLFKTCKQGGEVRRWLLEDVELHPEFNPNGRAPVTQARAKVLELVKGEPEMVLEDFLEGRDAVTARFVTEKLREAGVDARTRSLGRILANTGFTFIKQLRFGTKKQRVWGRANRNWDGDDGVIRAALAWMMTTKPEDQDAVPN